MANEKCIKLPASEKSDERYNKTATAVQLKAIYKQLIWCLRAGRAAPGTGPNDL